MFTTTNEDSLDHLVQLAISYCQQRFPEGLNTIFDNQPPGINQQILIQVCLLLKDDINTSAWFCGYMSSEINCTEDNHKESHPITELSYLLISIGMEPFNDFTPYLGCRLIINNIEKFYALPVEIKNKVYDLFNLKEISNQGVQEMNNALIQEWIVSQ